MFVEMKSVLKWALLALVCTSTLKAHAQWQWLDANGRKVFSDQAPPAGTPENRILKRPGANIASSPPSQRPAETEPLVKTPSSSVAPDLEKASREMKAREEQAELAFRERERQTIAQNCQQARRSLATLAAGTRISTVNDKGESDFLSDDQRLADTQRLQGYIGAYCQ